MFLTYFYFSVIVVMFSFWFLSRASKDIRFCNCKSYPSKIKVFFSSEQIFSLSGHSKTYITVQKDYGVFLNFPFPFSRLQLL